MQSVNLIGDQTNSFRALYQRPVVAKAVLEELVGDEPLGDDNDKVKLLAAEKPPCVRVVLVVEVLL